MERKPRIELKCTGCGETNPPQFEICWNCGRSLDDALRVEVSSSSSCAAVPASKSDAHASDTVSAANPSDRWSDWCELIAVLLVTFVTQTLWLYMWQEDAPQPQIIHRELAWLPYEIGLIMLLWLLVRRDKRVQQPVTWSKLVWWHELLFGLLIMMAGWMLQSVVLLFTDSGLPDGKAPETKPHLEGALLAAQCLLLLVPAAYEEVLFRVYLQSKLQSLLGGRALWPIVISAGLFATWHGRPLGSMLDLFTWGAFVGTIYQQTHRLPRLVLAHWLHNMWLACIPLLRVG